MNVALIILIVVLVIIIALVIYLISVYNSLQRARLMVQNQLGQIETDIEKRFSLIPNLVNTVKGYAAHEANTLEEVVKMRGNYQQANPQQRQQLEQQMAAKVNSFLINVERYPDLKANTNFLELQQELTQIEDDIAIQRKLYNDAVTTYNMKIQVFPANLVANMFGFKQAALYQSEDGAQSAPVVQF